METVETVETVETGGWEEGERRGVVDVAECVETVETVEMGGWEEGSAGEDSRTVRALAAGSFPAITRMSSASDASKESSIGYNVETWKRGNREGGKGAERRAVGRGNGGKRREIDALEEGMALRSIEFAARTSSSAVLVAPSRFCGVLARSRRMRSYVRRGFSGSTRADSSTNAGNSMDSGANAAIFSKIR